MKKLERRAILCLILAALLIAGLCVYVFRYVAHGSDWAMFFRNQHIYKNGYVAIGNIYDRNGVALAQNGAGENGSIKYNDSVSVRRGTLHAVGDMKNNISTAAESAFRDKLVGYNLVTGTYNITGRGHDLHLSIDADVSAAAYEAMNGRDGLVGVYNYKTGEIICMYSGPSYDPINPPSAANAPSGAYINKFLSAKYAPGSTFKLLTSVAAIETLDSSYLENFRYTCTGTREINGEKIRCTEAHGTVDFDGALSHSCNCAYSVLAQKVGAEAMTDYVDQCGLTTQYNMDGVKNAAGSFDFPSSADLNLAWAGIGQWKDQVNPCSFLVFLGAIANDGRSVEPELFHSALHTGNRTKRMMGETTASRLRTMMKNNVESEYGANRFPGLSIYAKTGTAEVAGQRQNAWFAGFIDNPGCPYAFIVCVEKGGFGIQSAAPVANTVLQKLVEKYQE